MKTSKITLVASWDGWCGNCSDSRPLSLTRTGSFSLRAWWGGADSEDHELLLTCRLCGVGVIVPHEDDDPEIIFDEEPATIAEGASTPASQPDGSDLSDLSDLAELTDARERLARAMQAVVARRSADAPTMPTQRPAAAVPAGDTDDALHLLALGFDHVRLVPAPSGRS